MFETFTFSQDILVGIWHANSAFSLNHHLLASLIAAITYYLVKKGMRISSDFGNPATVDCSIYLR